MARHPVFARLLPRLTAAERSLEDLELCVSGHIQRVEQETAMVEKQDDPADGIGGRNPKPMPANSHSNRDHELDLIMEESPTESSEDEANSLFNNFMGELSMARQVATRKNPLHDSSSDDSSSDEEEGEEDVGHTRHTHRNHRSVSSKGMRANEPRKRTATLKEDRRECAASLQEVEEDLSEAMALKGEIRTLRDLCGRARRLAAAGKGPSAAAALRRFKRCAGRVGTRMADLEPW